MANINMYIYVPVYMYMHILLCHDLGMLIKALCACSHLRGACVSAYNAAAWTNACSFLGGAKRIGNETFDCVTRTESKTDRAYL